VQLPRKTAAVELRERSHERSGENKCLRQADQQKKVVYKKSEFHSLRRHGQGKEKNWQLTRAEDEKL